MENESKRKTKNREVIIENENCLLLQYNDLKLFTDKKNLYLLLPTAKKLPITLSYVKVKKSKILGLQQLVEKLNAKESMSDVEFEILVQKYPKEEVKKKEQTNPTDTGPVKSKQESCRLINEYIKAELLKGNAISDEKVINYCNQINCKWFKTTIKKEIGNVKEYLHDLGIKVKYKKGVYEADFDQLARYFRKIIKTKKQK